MAKTHKLMNELQGRRKLQSIRDLGGMVHTSPRKIAEVLASYWNGVAVGGVKTVAECKALSVELGLSQRIDYDRRW